MKIIPLLFLACCLVIRAAEPTAFQDVGRREAGRLREKHKGWLEERTREVNFMDFLMDVPSAEHSKEAKNAGFVGALVDSQVVMIFSSNSDSSAAGFLFGRPTRTKMALFEKVGFVFQRLGDDVFVFAVSEKKELKKAPGTTPPSVPPPFPIHFAEYSDADLKKMSGRWSLVSYRVDGRTLEQPRINYLFTETTLTIIADTIPEVRREYSLRVDSRKNAKEMDMTEFSPNGRSQIAEGIYELEGDSLRWCHLSGKRPAGFPSSDYPGGTVVSLRRVGDE